MKITVLIVDDEPEMIYILKKVVEEFADVEVVGEAADGAEAIKLFEEKSPQVVFLDIELPAKDGVTLAREMFDINPKTIIIFATAFSDYREEAFGVYAFDYLVKPFKLNRLRQTMERIIKSLTGKAENASPSVAESHLPKLVYDDIERKQLFRKEDKLVYLNLDEIIFATREVRKSAIYYIGGCIETNASLAELEEQFHGYPFYRSHASFIVNLRMIKEFIPYGKKGYELIMKKTNEKPLMTIDRFKKLEERKV